MADNPEFTAGVESGTEEVIGRLINDQDWEEEEKQNIQKEYMKEFEGVMQEMMPMIISLNLGRKPTVEKTTDDDDDDDGEALEKAKVRHEATVIVVAKRRTKYPETLSKLLGKTNRLKKETAAVMKVDMQLAEPMEGVGTSDLDNTYFDILKEEVNESLLESTHKIMMDVERLSSLVDFAKVTQQMDPLSSIFDDYSTYRNSKSS